MKQHEETAHQSSLNYHEDLDREYKSSYVHFVRDTTRQLIFTEHRLSVQLANHNIGYKKIGRD